MRVNAAVFENLYAPLCVTELEIDAPRPGEVLVKIVASGVCHTDRVNDTLEASHRGDAIKPVLTMPD